MVRKCHQYGSFSIENQFFKDYFYLNVVMHLTEYKPRPFFEYVHLIDTNNDHEYKHSYCQQGAVGQEENY